jgi:hypothetical protein
MAHHKIVFRNQVMNCCLKFAVWSDDPIEGLSKCLASFNGGGNLWSMDDAIFRPQFLKQLVAPFVDHF